MTTSKTTGKTKTKAETRKRSVKAAAPHTANDVTPSPTTGGPVSQAAIADLAYRLFLERGGQHGNDFDDWLNAERQLAGS